MKNRLLLITVLFVILLSACGPAQTGFNGQWTTNVAVLTLTQNGDQVTGTAKGYGGYWDVSLKLSKARTRPSRSAGRVTPSCLLDAASAGSGISRWTSSLRAHMPNCNKKAGTSPARSTARTTKNSSP